MRKVILYMATSLDGFIARADGSVDWIDTETELEEEFRFETFLASVDTLLMGRKSYEQAVSFGEWPWANHRVLVFSQRGLTPETPNTEVVRDFDPGFIRELKHDRGKDIWLFGGGALNHTFLMHDLIDELMLFVQPIAVSSGIGIFGGASAPPKAFSLKKAQPLAGGFTLLHYVN